MSSIWSWERLQGGWRGDGGGGGYLKPVRECLSCAGKSGMELEAGGGGGDLLELFTLPRRDPTCVWFAPRARETTQNWLPGRSRGRQQEPGDVLS